MTSKEKQAEYQRRYREANREKIREAGRNRYAANREKVQEQKRRYREAHPDKAAEAKQRYLEKNRERYNEMARLNSSSEKRRQKHLQYRYGMTPEEYDAKRAAQEGLCAICGKAEEVLHIDHCHHSGRVRGLLCRPCNQMLGMAGESTCTLLNAAAYLDYHRGEVIPNGSSGPGAEIKPANADRGDDRLR